MHGAAGLFLVVITFSRKTDLRFLGTFIASVYDVGMYQSVEVGWRYSTDNGATWSAVPGALPGRSSERYASSAVLAPPLPLAAGTTYRFALWGSVASGSTTPTAVTATDVVCQIEVAILGGSPAWQPGDE